MLARIAALGIDKLEKVVARPSLRNSVVWTCVFGQVDLQEILLPLVTAVVPKLTVHCQSPAAVECRIA